MQTPRYYQAAAHDAAWKYLAENDQGNALIVLPTGSGKSLVIAMLCQQAIDFGARVVVLQHRKELIQQNAEKIQALLPDVFVGLYSAGLKSRQSTADVVCAGIQSVFKHAATLGRRELVLIDEAHLVSMNDESMYGRFLSEILTDNPSRRVVGLTATPFRTGEGPLCGRSKLFQRIVYESFTGDLIREGFLCEITNKSADAEVNTEGIKLRGGEFIEHEMQLVFNTESNVSSACREIVEKCAGRHSVLVFSSGVLHAEEIAGTLHRLTGQDVGLVTGLTLPIERSTLLSRFKRNELRWLVNCDVLTTGFDAPCIDAIAVLRATMSPGLFAQMIGRGLRKHESKINCQVLDFGENIKRHGSIDDPQYGRASVDRQSKLARAAEINGRGKECPNCGIDVPSRAVVCDECGFKFPVNHSGSSDESSAMTGEYAPDHWIVESVTWSKHTKRTDPSATPTLRINYEVQPAEGLPGNIPKWVFEWVCIEHMGYARVKAGLWWQARSISECPETIEDALSLLNRGALRMPSKLTTVREGKYTRIVMCEFSDERPEEWSDEVEAEEQFEVMSGVDDDVPF